MFIDNLKNVCREKGTSATALVASLGMSTGNISKWAAGNLPSTEVIIRLSNALGVSSDELLGIKKPAANSDGKSELDIKLMQALPKMTDMEKRLLLERIDTLLELRGLK